MATPTSRSVGRISLFMAAALLIAGCGKSTAGEPPTTASAAADAAQGKLSGLYVRQQMISLAMGGRITFSLQREFFYFFPDGHIVFGVPDGEIKEHPAAADFAPFKDLPPEQRGTYAVKNGQITFHPEKGNERTEPFSIPKVGDDSVLQIGPPSIVGSVKALPFNDDQKLDGSYQYDGTVGLGAANTVFNVQSLAFHADGSLGSDHLSGVDTAGVETAVGSSGVTAHSQTVSTGTYRLSGYTLETKLAGKTEKASAFRWAGDDKPNAPGMMCIAGRVYSRQEAKK